MIWNRPLTSACRALLGAIALCSASRCADAAEEVKLRRWAIIATKDEQAARVGDLLTAKLSEQKGVELVERERLDEVLKEIKLSALSSSTASTDRLSLGNLLKADGLVIISVEKRPDRSVLKTVFCETSYGLRLRVEYHLVESGADEIAKQCAAKLERVRKHYSGGVKYIIGVPSFVSKNLSHDFDHLQAGYASLLQNALMDYAGVAVIESEEVRMIGREIDLTGAKLKNRVVPLFVEGEFRMSASAKDEEPTVSLVVALSDAHSTVRTIEQPKLVLGAVSKWLLNRLPGDVLRLADDKRIEPLSQEQQFLRLAARARRLSNLGAWEHSIPLQEAALLLRPDDAEQRIALLADYVRHFKLRNNAIRGKIHTHVATLNIPWQVHRRRNPKHWVAATEELVESWRIMLYHLLRLIDQRKLNPREAAFLLVEIRFVGRQFLVYRHPRKNEVDKYFVDVVEQLYPSLSRLDCRIGRGTIRPSVHLVKFYTADTQLGSDEWRPSWQYDLWASELLKSLVDAVNRNTRDYRTGVYDRGMRDETTRKKVFHFLTQVARRDMPPVGYARKLFEPKGTFNSEFSKEARKFYQQLCDLDNEHAVYYGRFGQWALTVTRNPDTPIERWVKPTSPGGRYPDDDLFDPVRVAKRNPHQHRIPRVELTAKASKAVLAKKVHWKKLDLSLDGRNRYDHFGIVRCTDEIDLIWHHGACRILRKNRPVVTWKPKSEDRSIISVAWDGEQVWIATNVGGIAIVSLDGKVLARVDRRSGLPEYRSKIKNANIVGHVHKNPFLRLHPVGPGRCIAIGVLGDHGRLWFADVTRIGSGPEYKVNVFHEATKVDGDANKKKDEDTHQISEVRWTAGFFYKGKGGKRLLLVGRRERRNKKWWEGRKPLAIDLETLKVSVLPARIPSMYGEVTSQSVLCTGGRLFQASLRFVFVHEPPADGGDGEWSRQEVCRTQLDYPALMLHNGLIYCPGTKWTCIDPRTLASRLMSMPPDWKKPKRIQSAGLPRRWDRHALTANFGMIAWSRDGQKSVVARSITDLDDIAVKKAADDAAGAASPMK